MRIENIITKKENIEYAPGDVLIVCNAYGEEAYMVFKAYNMYNLIDLKKGKAFFSDNQYYDNFAENVGRLFYSAVIIGNHELELVRVED